MSNWVKRYKIYGYNGLDLKKGRHSKEQPLKKSIISSELTPPEKEGIRQVHRELLNRGYLVNHKRVQRLMHNMGLLGKRPKERYHSYKGNVADNIINRILMRVDHYKNGLLMYLNSILHGENVIFLQY